MFTEKHGCTVQIVQNFEIHFDAGESDSIEVLYTTHNDIEKIRVWKNKGIF